MMKVISIDYKKKEELFEITFDNENKMVLNYNIFERYNISIDKEISLEEYIEIKFYSDCEIAKQKGIKYISSRLKTEKEVKNKLIELGYNYDVITQVIYDLVDLGYLNDENYAKLFIEDKKNINGYGKNKIKTLLIQKGINRDIFEKYLEEIDYDAEYEDALNMGIKKLNTINETDENKVKNKLFNYLAYRGYNYDIVKRVLEEIL